MTAGPDPLEAPGTEVAEASSVGHADNVVVTFSRCCLCTIGGISKTHVESWVPVVVVVAAVRLGLVTLSVSVANESSLVEGAEEEEEEEEEEARFGGWMQPAASFLPQTSCFRHHQVLEEAWQQTPSGGMQPSQQGTVDPGQTVPSSMGGWDGDGDGDVVDVDWEVAAAVRVRRRKRRDVDVGRSIFIRLLGSFLGVSRGLWVV